MADLFADSDDLEDLALKTENEYAKRYDTWREKEELHKLEQKYGENPTEADLEDSDSEESDDEPPDVPERLEKDFLKTLSLLKKKDPRIYDPGFKFFEKGEEKNVEDKIEKEVVEAHKKPVVSLAEAFGASDGESDGEIFTVEKPADKPPPVKEEKLREFLTGKAERLGDETEADLQTLKALWSDPKLNEGEAFLRDYILNKKYLSADGEEGGEGRLLDDADLEADAALVEEQGKFERAYNFRFEEPDHEYLKRYPRTMSTVRPKDDRRARKRAEVRERKDAEKQRKMEEIARMKALKLKEIQEKIAKIKEVTGNKDLAFKDEDIEGEFDPAEHDRRMRAIFDEQYYDGCDTEKPVFPDLDEELEIENWDKYEEESEDNKKNSKNAVPHCEDDDFNMDADYDPARARTTLMEEIQETLGKKRRNRKRKTKLAQILSREKPKFDPATAEKTYSEYMEEYYKMDCEDVIGGDLPTRFKYRDVVPNSYGLSVEEILLADDKELNKWVPLKKTVKYRPEHVEKSEVKTYQQKANDLDLKRKLIPSLFKETEETVVETMTKKKKRKKKKNKVEIPAEGDLFEPSKNAATANVSVEVSVNEMQEENPEKKRKKKKRNTTDQTMTDNLADGNGTHELTVDKTDIPKKKKKLNNELNQQSLETETVETSRNGHILKKKFRNNAQKKQKTKANENNHDSTILSTSKSEVTAVISNQKKCKKPKANLEINENASGSNESAKGKSMKRKHPFEVQKSQGKKMKFNPKSKHKSGKNAGSDNPMDKLSDERLKAYGLNPKKYRSFLKYKKF